MVIFGTPSGDDAERSDAEEPNVLPAPLPADPPTNETEPPPPPVQSSYTDDWYGWGWTGGG